MIGKTIFAPLFLFNIVQIVVDFRQQTVADEFHIGQIHAPLLLLGSYFYHASLKEEPGTKESRKMMWYCISGNIFLWTIALC